MKTIVILSTFIICYVTILVVMAIIPFITRKTESFGVSIPEDVYRDGEVEGIRKKYRNSMLIYGGAFAAAVLAVSFAAGDRAANLLLTLGVFVEIGLSFLFYINGHRKMKALKSERNWTAGRLQTLVVDTGFRNRKLMVSPLWFVSYLVVIAFTLAMGILLYDKMPERIPMQYNYAGEVTRYMSKSYKAVFWAPFVQLILSVIMLYSYWMIGKSKQQVDTANPQKSIEQNQLFRYRWSAFAVFTGLGMLGLFCFMQMFSVGLVKNTTLLLVVPMVFAAAIVVVSIVLSVAMGQGGGRIRIIAGEKDGSAASEPINRDDDRYWKLGIFYFNSDDPSLFIEKRFGVGWTNNWARPASWLILLGIFALIAIMAFGSEKLTK